MNKYSNSTLVHTHSEKFGDDLVKSIEEGKKDYWKTIFANFFTDYDYHTDNPDKNADQVAGVDCYVYLKNGKVITVDQKIRNTNFTDIALEYKHVLDNKTTRPGWVTDPKYCPDYIFYHVLPLKRTYILPTQQLKLFWKRYGQKLLQHYPPKTSLNDGWRTYFIAVPSRIIYEGINRSYCMSSK